MSGGAAAGAAAAAAAARAAEQMRQEEEEMTTYNREDLDGDWEFKILRSNTAAFRKAHVLRSACEEEGRAGWVMVEKFDNSRLRFKRPASAKASDASLHIDPYRTQFGMPTGMFVAVVVVASLLGAVILLPVLFKILDVIFR